MRRRSLTLYSAIFAAPSSLLMNKTAPPCFDFRSGSSHDKYQRAALMTSVSRPGAVSTNGHAASSHHYASRMRRRPSGSASPRSARSCAAAARHARRLAIEAPLWIARFDDGHDGRAERKKSLLSLGKAKVRHKRFAREMIVAAAPAEDGQMRSARGRRNSFLLGAVSHATARLQSIMRPFSASTKADHWHEASASLISIGLEMPAMPAHNIIFLITTHSSSSA